MQVKFHGSYTPVKGSDLSSGFDLRADIGEGKTLGLGPGEFKAIPTGIRLEIPEGYEGQVRPRSGLAAKNGVTVLNSPGTVDADYRGEVKVILINHSGQHFTITHGDRIAQLVIAEVDHSITLELVKDSEELSETDRGSGGFGSSGIK